MNATDDNVDPAEVRKFARAAARWWDLQGEFKPLHDLNPLRVDFIERRSPLAGKTALDVGCGGGILAEAMAARGAVVTGIDAGDAPLAVARLHGVESGVKVTYRRMTAEALAAEVSGGGTVVGDGNGDADGTGDGDDGVGDGDDGVGNGDNGAGDGDDGVGDGDTDAAEKKKWDIVCCLELLEHVPDPAAVVSACAALTKPGGAVYFSTINRNPKSFLFAIVGAEYVLKLLPRGTHDYAKLIRPSELARWCERAGLKVVDLTGIHYHPFAQTYSLGDGVDVNYLMHCQKP